MQLHGVGFNLSFGLQGLRFPAFSASTTSNGAVGFPAALHKLSHVLAAEAPGSSDLRLFFQAARTQASGRVAAAASHPALNSRSTL